MISFVFVCVLLFIPVVSLDFEITAMLDVLAYAPRDPYTQLTLSLCVLGLFLATVLIFALKPKKDAEPTPNSVEAYLKFIYGCFLKPHTGDGTGSQQDALVCRHSFARSEILTDHRKVSTRRRPVSTMLREVNSCEVARTCWV